MPLRKPWLILLITIVITVIGVSLYVSGSPIRARAERFDTKRVNDLQQISYALDSFWAVNHRLPKNLEELITPQNQSASYYVSSIRDPKTGQLYEYRTLEHSQPDGDPNQLADEPGNYELCAVFERSKTENALYQAPSNNIFWEHGAGRSCLGLTVRTLDQPAIK
jgi:hypothetical protein